MYTRLSNRFCKNFVSSVASCKNEHLSISSAYQHSSAIISDRLRYSPTPSSYFSNLSCGTFGTATMNGQGGKFDVTYEQLLEAQKNSSILIVDVREQSEIDTTGKLPGSIHIPMGNVSNTLKNLPEEEFMEKYDKPKPTKHTKIIFSCQSGGRSKKIQAEIQKLGYDNVYNYAGGWKEWSSKKS